ncbi:MAG: hypothetical protein QNL33_08535 [Akkermansiaceae bacterium]
MIRRLSASFFLLGMVVLVLLQQPAFAYCGHTHQFFISDCGCEDEVVENACPHCQQEEVSKPCDDCSEKFQVDVDDLVWSDLAMTPLMECSCAISDGEAAPLTFKVASSVTVAPARPPPPPPGPSLFLLYSVFQI